MPITDIEESHDEQTTLSALRRYTEQRSLAKDATLSQADAAKVLKGWLDNHPGQTLKDRELGWTVEYQTKEGPGSWDIGSMPDQVVLDLARAGAFVAAQKPALDALSKAQPRLGAAIQKYKIPGGEQLSLSVTNKP
ncbi:MAG: hypothetical protein O3A47_13565 [Chloroflexi bacterium]|nr:hypothetical protein [Chloroflexota bacterium]